MLTEQAGLCLCDTELSPLPFDIGLLGRFNRWSLCVVYNIQS